MGRPTLLYALFMVLATAACGDGDSEVLGGRLIPPGDADFLQLEAPEAPNECSTHAQCEVSCVWSCIPTREGPVTCPDPPPSQPARVRDALCLCAEGICAYFD